jgi:chromosome segregation ATPase
VGIEEAIRQRLEICGPNRRDRVFAVCELWQAEHGTPIQLAKLREFVGRGSMTDLSRDLKEFAAVVAQRHRHMLSLPDTPPAFVAALEEAGKTLWVAAMESASSQFEAQRNEHLAELARVREETDIANKQRDLAMADRNEMVRQRDIAAGRADDSEREVSSLKSVVAAAEQKILVLERSVLDLTRDLAAEREARDKDARRAALDIDLHKTTAERAEKAVLRADERVQAIEKRLSDENVVTEGLRARAMAAEKTAAELQGRLEAMQEQMAVAIEASKAADALRVQLADLQSRHQSTEKARDQGLAKLALMERDLATSTERFSEAVEDNVSLSHQITTLSAAVEQKTSAIQALEAKVADLESRGKN